MRTDVSFSEHKGVVKIDEKGHTDKNQNEEDERQSKLKKPFWLQIFLQDYSWCRAFRYFSWNQ